ncbi:MBL fold metallo-hydrolase [Marimonas lutisalis]|uniref:MBL fold metallo-hydrolase n=1 Tax=Marimonas lutisalis TaxID=2545756 RepID=UPI0010FA2175|nr:MBL fold metallo-hydrolase [Marimonas lutisalis]
MLRLILAFCLISTAAQAQTRLPSHCVAIADATPGIEYLHKASFRDPLPDYSVRISYIAHASFLIQSPAGINAVTDYTGFIGNTDLVPDVVTMNHAHETHWTNFPDPRIPHVLQGWGEEFGKGIDHALKLGDMIVRNVSTDIRSGMGGVEAFGNSIFVFEVEGLCIGHLGHLHHEPNEAQYAALGRVDVVMAAVDGGMTVDQPTMIKILKRLKSSVVIPMHWFGDFTLQAFIRGMEDEFAIVNKGETSLTVSLRTLPARPTVHVLFPRYLRDPD